MTTTFEVLLEFGGSRLPLTVTAETLYSAVKDAANVDVVLPGADQQSGGDLYLLQRFSEKWSTFVDVKSLDDVKESDRLTLTLYVSRSTTHINTVYGFIIKQVSHYYFSNKIEDKLAEKSAPIPPILWLCTVVRRDLLYRATLVYSRLCPLYISQCLLPRC